MGGILPMKPLINLKSLFEMDQNKLRGVKVRVVGESPKHERIGVIEKFLKRTFSTGIVHEHVIVLSEDDTSGTYNPEFDYQFEFLDGPFFVADNEFQCPKCKVVVLIGHKREVPSPLGPTVTLCIPCKVSFEDRVRDWVDKSEAD